MKEGNDFDDEDTADFTRNGNKYEYLPPGNSKTYESKGGFVLYLPRSLDETQQVIQQMIDDQLFDISVIHHQSFETSFCSFLTWPLSSLDILLIQDCLLIINSCLE
jgi:hypothetical protein